MNRHQVTEPGGIRAVREVIHHNGSAVIVPRLPNGRIVLVRQFRFAAGDYLWELPAGSCAEGERPLQTARRELEEETGYHSKGWRRLVEFFPSPGILDERMTIFLANDVVAGVAHPEADEKISVRSFSIAELTGMIRSRRIRDGKTLIGLLYWKQLGKAK